MLPDIYRPDATPSPTLRVGVMTIGEEGSVEMDAIWIDSEWRVWIDSEARVALKPLTAEYPICVIKTRMGYTVGLGHARKRRYRLHWNRSSYDSDPIQERRLLPVDAIV